MGISALQQEAFNASPGFNNQVNSVVKENAVSTLKALAAGEGDSNLLANVIRNPQSYGFPAAMVADAAWDVTYDAWAADPAAADYAILSNVQALFNKLTGYQPPVAAPP
jgi:hypothetical protein